MPEKPLKILIVAAEASPFARVGHVAEVVSSLPAALHKLGHDVRLVIPRYGRINPIKFDLKPIAALQNLEVPVNFGNEHLTEVVSITEGELAPATMAAPAGEAEASAVKVYFVNNDRYFNREGIYGYPDDDERFVLFCRAVLEMLPDLGWQPDIIHCHEWHTALIPNWLKTIYADQPFYRPIASVYTIHNLAYQGVFGLRVLEIAGIEEISFMVTPRDDNSRVVSLMSLGIRSADVVNTVSPTYARQILTPQYGENLEGVLNERPERLFGILNGIDVQRFNPTTDVFLAEHFEAKTLDKRRANKLDLQRETKLPENPDVPLIGMISRLANQKGLDILAQCIERILQDEVQFVLMGTGDQFYQDLFRQMALKYPDKMSFYLTFRTPQAQKIYGGSDLFLMPSRTEPCGLGQMIAMRYGSIPVVRNTGGLADTVSNFDPTAQTGNGFTFDDYDADHLYDAITRATTTFHRQKVWHNLVARVMQADYSWNASAARYTELYHLAQDFHTADIN